MISDHLLWVSIIYVLHSRDHCIVFMWQLTLKKADNQSWNIDIDFRDEIDKNSRLEFLFFWKGCSVVKFIFWVNWY